MESYARLAALDLSCSRILHESDIEFEAEKESLIIKKLGVEHSFSLTDSSLDHVYVEDFPNRFNCAQELLSRSLKELIKATAYEVVYKQLDQQDLFAELRGGQVRWAIKGSSMNVVSKEEVPTYEKLLVARALIEGYKLTEYVGSHFIVETPSLLKRMTTLYGCDCNEFQQQGSCLHQHLVQAALSNRRTFLKYNLIHQYF